MTLVGWVIFVFSLIPFAPLIIGLIKQKDQSQTFLTWILYLILDCITMFSNIKVGPHGYVMLFGFAVGSLIMSAILFYQKRFARWSLVETITLLLITICLIIWKLGGSYWALTSGIASETIVGLYLMRRTFRDPVVRYNMSGYSLFLLVSVITLLTAQEWTISEVGFALPETILNSIILIPLIIKRRKEKRESFYKIL